MLIPHLRLTTIIILVVTSLFPNHDLWGSFYGHSGIIPTKMLMILYESLILSVILCAASIFLLVCHSAMQSLERTQIIPLHTSWDFPMKQLRSFWKYRESGIILIRPLIKKEVVKYLLRSASRPIPNNIVHWIHQIKNPESIKTPCTIPTRVDFWSLKSFMTLKISRVVTVCGFVIIFNTNHVCRKLQSSCLGALSSSDFWYKKIW